MTRDSQGDLFVHAHKLARVSDPAPSHEAARAHTNTSNANAQRQRCLAACRQYPGQHSRRYDEILDEREVARKRLPELRSLGLVFSSVKLAEDLGRRVQHWYPVR